MTKNLPAVGDKIHGWLITKVSPVLDSRAIAIETIHEKSGAQLLHLHTADAENLFAIAFATPPSDDTGLPHILEHTVLCGSQKFPVKDPFVELLKTSLATFLNAMTYPDRTIYPCASMNHRDFFNLARVYADAVFAPRLLPEHFAQEGWHYEITDDQKLTINGVVYNEMKGAYSDLDGILSRAETSALFPDNAYGRDYGGDPQKIPQLTYEQFRVFHSRYYHPSNARIFIYGDISTVEHLQFLDTEYLQNYERLAIDSAIAPLQKWTAPRQIEVNFPAEATAVGAVELVWSTGKSTDFIRSLALDFIDDYFLAHAASPLRQALIDSHLGGELTDCGYRSHQRDAYFSVGLRGAKPSSANAIEQLILDTLRAESERGFSRERLETVFTRSAMTALEIKSAYPLRLMNAVYGSWFYGEDPTTGLHLREQLRELRAQWENTPRYFENILRDTLLDNPHRARITAIPDSTYNQKREQSFVTQMTEIVEKLSPAAREQILVEQAKIAALQTAPNSPEELASLPVLTLADVNPQPLELSPNRRVCAERFFLEHDLFTNGVNYLTLAIDLRDLTADELRYLPFYALALEKMGAGGLDYAALANAEAACGSEVTAHCEINSLITNADAATPYLRVSVKALSAKLTDALQIIEWKLFNLDLTDAQRLHDILMQNWHNERAGLIESGHLAALSNAAGNLSLANYWRENIGGIAHLRLSNGLAENFNAAEITVILRQIQQKIGRGARLTASFAGEQNDLTADWFAKISAAMGSAKIDDGDWNKFDFSPRPFAAGIAAPCDVAFVAQAFPTIAATHPDAAALLLLANYLSYNYLWNEVRAKRGAYGCGAVFAPTNGFFGFRSYRDPCVNETLATYRAAADYILHDANWSTKEVENAIIGTIKKLDQPLRPGYVVGVALDRELCGSSPEYRRLHRSRLLNLTIAEIKNSVEKHLLPYSSAVATTATSICILSSQEKLAAAQRAGFSQLQIENLIVDKN